MLTATSLVRVARLQETNMMGAISVVDQLFVAANVMV